MNAIKRQNQKCQKSTKGCRSVALISVANQCDNPLLKLDQNFHTFSKNDMNLSLSCLRWPQIDEDCKQWMIQLIEDNMKSYYESSAWGWSRSIKLKELGHKTARHLLLKCLHTNRLIAFATFRFETGGTDAESALYCYELQVTDTNRRSGIGQYLMSCLEQIGRTFHMKKVMLTVFKRNEIAFNFYTNALKYRIDRSSPSRCQMAADYEILCLSIDRKN